MQRRLAVALSALAACSHPTSGSSYDSGYIGCGDLYFFEGLTFVFDGAPPTPGRWQLEAPGARAVCTTVVVDPETGESPGRATCTGSATVTTDPVTGAPERMSVESYTPANAHFIARRDGEVVVDETYAVSYTTNTVNGDGDCATRSGGAHVQLP